MSSKFLDIRDIQTLVIPDNRTVEEGGEKGEVPDALRDVLFHGTHHNLSQHPPASQIYWC